MEYLKSNIPICLKVKVYHQCIEPAITYDCQTLAITKRMQERLRTMQRSMECSMIGVTKRDYKTNMWVRQTSKVHNIMEHVKTLKWRWAGHVARMNDNKWTKLVTE